MIIRNNIFPFRGFLAMAIWPVIFVRKGPEVSPVTLNHEQIHHAQQKELLLVGFYALYGLEYIVRLLIWLHRLGWDERKVAAHLAYRTISFEVEAYNNETNQDYLKERSLFAWTRQ